MNTIQETKTTQEGAWIGIQEIDVPDYARKHKPEGVDSLSVDMGKNGQLQNIVLVKKVDGRYECIIGNGRLEAAKKLGWDKIRADVKEGLSEGQKLFMTLSENSEREDVSPFYTADLYNRIMAAEKLGSEALPERLGKARATVYDYLALAKLPAEVRAMSERSDMGFRQWREIARLPKPEDQVKLAQECADKDYSVRELQARVKQLLNPTKTGIEAPAKPAGDEKSIRFSWKDGKLAVKIQPVDPTNLQGFLIDVELEWKRFVDLHPMPIAHPKAEEVAQAA
jgi:ParB/RepB/Spo0J family partition protein